MKNGRRAVQCIVLIFCVTVATFGCMCRVAAAMPSEVQKFLDRRELCDHFRGEPTDGNSPQQIERRRFVNQQSGKYCRGTDAQRRSLISKYASDPQVVDKLEALEESIEGHAD